MDENRSLVWKIVHLGPTSSYLRLGALEEQIHPINTTQKSPLDLRLYALESKPPEIIFLPLYNS